MTPRDVEFEAAWQESMPIRRRDTHKQTAQWWYEQGRTAAWNARGEPLLRLANAQQKLLTAYRLGSQPNETTLNTIEELSGLLFAQPAPAPSPATADHLRDTAEMVELKAAARALADAVDNMDFSRGESDVAPARIPLVTLQRVFHAANRLRKALTPLKPSTPRESAVLYNDGDEK